MRARPLVLTCSMAALLGLGMAAPAPAAVGRQQASRMRFEAMDANHDGRITRNEWRGSDRSFDNHDWNGDGVLSGDEVRPGAQRTTDWRSAGSITPKISLLKRTTYASTGSRTAFPHSVHDPS